MKTQVIFEYEEDVRKWEVYVTNVENELEARQAFNAVILTARIATPELESNKATLVSENKYKNMIEVLLQLIQ